MSEEESVSLKSSSSSHEKPAPEGSDSESSSDKPNITVGKDKEVHLKQGQTDNSDEGSIVAQQQEYPIDESKDPKISHAPEPAKAEQSQSKCCILI